MDYPYSSSLLADAGALALSPELHVIDIRTAFRGPCLTVQLNGATVLGVIAALKRAAAGDVIVVDAALHQDRAMFGGILAEMALAQKVAGIVLDGYHRDVVELAEMRFPLASKGIRANGPVSRTSGAGPLFSQLASNVRCGGVEVHSGDWIVADADGVVCIPRGKRKEICAKASEKLESEEKLLAEIRSGQIFSPSLLERLRTQGLSL